MYGFQKEIWDNRSFMGAYHIDKYFGMEQYGIL